MRNLTHNRTFGGARTFKPGDAGYARRMEADTVKLPGVLQPEFVKELEPHKRRAFAWPVGWVPCFILLLGKRLEQWAEVWVNGGRVDYSTLGNQVDLIGFPIDLGKFKGCLGQADGLVECDLKRNVKKVPAGGIGFADPGNFLADYRDMPVAHLVFDGGWLLADAKLQGWVEGDVFPVDGLAEQERKDFQLVASSVVSNLFSLLLKGVAMAGISAPVNVFKAMGTGNLSGMCDFLLGEKRLKGQPAAHYSLAGSELGVATGDKGVNPTGKNAVRPYRWFGVFAYRFLRLVRKGFAPVNRAAHPNFCRFSNHLSGGGTVSAPPERGIFFRKQPGHFMCALVCVSVRSVTGNLNQKQAMSGRYRQGFLILLNRGFESPPLRQF